MEDICPMGCKVMEERGFCSSSMGFGERLVEVMPILVVYLDLEFDILLLFGRFISGVGVVGNK